MTRELKGMRFAISFVFISCCSGFPYDEGTEK